MIRQPLHALASPRDVLPLCLAPAAPRLETAYLDSGVAVQRPVIRLGGSIFLTRIDPSKPSTSMLLRYRPGWQDLAQALAGAGASGDGKQRFDVYVCTTAERGCVDRKLSPGVTLAAPQQERRRLCPCPASCLQVCARGLAPV